MIRPPPRSTLFPTRRSSDLAHALADEFEFEPQGAPQPEVADDRERLAPGDRVILLVADTLRSEEHTSELQSRRDLVCRLLLEKKNIQDHKTIRNYTFTRFIV